MLFGLSLLDGALGSSLIARAVCVIKYGGTRSGRSLRRSRAHGPFRVPHNRRCVVWRCGCRALSKVLVVVATVLRGRVITQVITQFLRATAVENGQQDFVKHPAPEPGREVLCVLRTKSVNVLYRQTGRPGVGKYYRLRTFQFYGERQGRRGVAHGGQNVVRHLLEGIVQEIHPRC